MKLATNPQQLFHPRILSASARTSPDVVESQHSSARSLPERALLTGTEMFRWMELDEAAAVFCGTQHGLVETLGMVDGLVAAYDGAKMFSEGKRENNRVAVVGGVARMALGMGGALPGLGGAISEGLLGGYQTIEGLCTKEKLVTVTGLTQLGVSVGMGLLCQGIGGALGPALILGCNAARVALFTHDRVARHAGFLDSPP